MKFKDENGKIHSKKIDKYSHGKKKHSKSNLQEEVGQILIESFPNFSILEEVPTTGTRPLLYLDFYIPQLKIAVEVNGNQHNEFNAFFHKNRQNFAKSKINDSKKEEWCLNNNIVLIVIEEKDLPNIRKIVYNGTNSRRNESL